MGNENHPVWDVYDKFRTARLNVKYWSGVLNSLSSENFWIELVLAVSASSTVAGLWFWYTLFGGTVWKVLSALAAFLAVLKPSLRLTDRVRRVEGLLVGYRALDHDLDTLCISIRQQGEYSKALKGQFDRALARLGDLVRRAPNEKTNEKLLRRCMDEVKRELPVENFFVPEG